MGPNKEGIGIWLEGTGVDDEKDNESDIGTMHSASDGKSSQLEDDEIENEGMSDEEVDGEDEQEEEDEERDLIGQRKIAGFFAGLEIDSDEDDVISEEDSRLSATGQPGEEEAGEEDTTTISRN